LLFGKEFLFAEPAKQRDGAGTSTTGTHLSILIMERPAPTQGLCLRRGFEMVSKQIEKRMNILIVNNQPWVPDLLSVELAQEGYRVMCARNTEAIWERLQNTRPDLVLFNHHLNETESWDVLFDINRRRPEIPVLIYGIKNLDALYRLKQTVTEVLSLSRSVSPALRAINLVKGCARGAL